MCDVKVELDVVFRLCVSLKLCFSDLQVSEYYVFAEIVEADTVKVNRWVHNGRLILDISFIDLSFSLDESPRKDMICSNW